MPWRNTKDFTFPFKTGVDVITTEWDTRVTVLKSKNENGKQNISCCYNDFIDILRRLLVDMMMAEITSCVLWSILTEKFLFVDLQTCWVYVACVWWFQWFSWSWPSINVFLNSYSKPWFCKQCSFHFQCMQLIICMIKIVSLLRLEI